MTSSVVKWSLGLAYGFVAVLVLIGTHEAYCATAGCTFTVTEGECGFPAVFLIPLAFTAFLMPALAALFLVRSVKHALLFGGGGLAAWLLATLTIIFLSEECAPLLAVANVTIFSTFITSAGAFIANYGEKA